MAPIRFYDISIGYYAKILKVLLRILKIASAHPDMETFLEARLAPDMFPLLFQVRNATRHPVALVEALTGKGLVKWNETQVRWGNENRSRWGKMEQSWPEVIARVEKTLAILGQVGPEEADAQVDGVTLPLQIGPDADGAAAFRQISAVDFTTSNGVPETFFHVFTAYGILRSRGVDIGKKDILMMFLPDQILAELAGKLPL